MSIQVLDHLIIGRNRYYSFADQGHIRKWEIEFGKGPEIILKALGEGLAASGREVERDGDGADEGEERSELRDHKPRRQRADDRGQIAQSSEYRTAEQGTAE